MPDSQVTDFVSWLEGRPIAGAVLIVLNQPIDDLALFDRAWSACSLRVVTDGGANRLIGVGRETGHCYTPDFIVGDFDSIDAEVRAWYTSQNVPFVTDTSVDATDFMKAMHQSHVRFDGASPQRRTFLAFGAIGGRVDHSWHSFLCLSLAAQIGDTLVLVSSQNLTVLLERGRHVISTPQQLVGPACGYVPLEGTATVNTGGFEWDVTDFAISFTTRLSTSNLLKSDQVWVETDKPLMFTVELHQK